MDPHTYSFLRRDHTRWLWGEIERRLPVGTSEIPLVLASVARFARFIYDLPASQEHDDPRRPPHHARPFGLIDHSLETAFWCLHEPAPFELRSFPAPLVKLGAFYGGLLHDLSVVERLSVIETDTTNVWDPSTEPLADFAGGVPNRRLLWRDSLPVPEEFHTAKWIDSFVPAPLADRIFQAIPVGTFAQLFRRWRDKNYPLSYGLSTFIRAADRSSQVDDTDRRSMRDVFELARRARATGSRIGSIVPAAPPFGTGEPYADLLVGRILTFALARFAGNAEADALVAAFQRIVDCPTYQLYRNHMDEPVARIEWGYIRQSKQDPDLCLTRGSGDLNLKLLNRRGKMRRYNHVYLAAEFFRRELRAHGLDATSALRRARGFLTAFIPRDRAFGQVVLPIPVRRQLDAFVRDHGPVVGLDELVAGALGAADALRKALDEARPIVEEVRLTLASRGPDRSANEAADILRRLYQLRLQFSDDPASLAAPRLVVTDGVLDRPTILQLRTRHLSLRQATAFARAIAPMYDHTATLARFERIAARMKAAEADLRRVALARSARRDSLRQAG